MNGCQAGRSVNFAAMRLLETDGRMTDPARQLLSAVARVSEALLRDVRILPRDRNWLRFPWYRGSKGGGAFVMGDRIYLHRSLLEDRRSHDLLDLLAHEVGHLAHAERFDPTTAVGRARFVLWAAGHYLRSALTHGRHAYQLARIEQEAERGRWVLRELIKTVGIPTLTQVMNGPERMRSFLADHAARISDLHQRYPGWPVAQR